MAQFATDFSEYETGRAPHDWVNAWVPAEQRFEVAEVEGALGGKALQHEIEVHNRRAWRWTAVPGSDEVEVLARLRSSSADSRFGILCRADGAQQRDTEEGVSLELFCGHLRDEAPFEAPRQEMRQTVFFGTYDPAQEAQRGPARPHGIGRPRVEEYYPWQAGEWNWMRLQARNEGGFIAVRFTVWSDGTPEPQQWRHDIIRTEPDHVGRQGWVGITGQRTEGVREYDYFAVGTDGDRAPAP
ncbi:hypothetical protein [Ruania rhizosphaerae]|uniref:hypothetical protein n=1 Tax=Ruania rhizosphaerae TaxID=1840413 RepID=UPI001357DDDB|nr:hypothetical protein [Ruania rhizosphaerae]